MGLKNLWWKPAMEMKRRGRTRGGEDTKEEARVGLQKRNIEIREAEMGRFYRRVIIYLSELRQRQIHSAHLNGQVKKRKESDPRLFDWRDEGAVQSHIIPSLSRHPKPPPTAPLKFQIALLAWQEKWYTANAQIHVQV